MKQVSIVISFLLFLFLFQNCTEEETVNAPKEKIQFTVGLSTLESTGGKLQSVELPTGASLLISIKSNSGEQIYTLYKVELLRVGGNVVTVPLELNPGSYLLTDFMLVNEENELLFAAPRRGSPLGSLVTRPLDVNFYVARNALTNIEMEVIDVSQSAPEEFGYASFLVNAVYPMQISVFRPYNKSFQLTNAMGYIVQGGDTLQTINLGARLNLIPFKQDPDDAYKLIIYKAGYATYSIDFTYNSLIAELAGLPLKVILSPEFSILAYIDTDISHYFKMYLRGISEASPSIHVDWGDGANDNYELNEYVMLEHGYATGGKYFVSITGDLDKITYLDSFYGYAMMDEINTEHLTELIEVSIGLTRSPRIVDLSNNSKLGTVFMPNAANTEIIDLAANNKVSYIDIRGANAFTTSSLEAFVDDVYYSVVAANRREGRFELADSWYQPTGAMIATPTPETLTKLRELRDVYGWRIVPDPE